MRCAMLMLLAAALPAAAAVRTATVEYRDGEAVLEGYVAYDDATAQPRPGVLVVHEWYGLNEYIRQRTRQLAQMGYTAFAADIYGKGRRAQTAEEAAKLAGPFRGDIPLLRRRAEAALAELRRQPNVQADRLAAIGFCFGGTTVLELARGGAELKAVVSFHGGLGTERPYEARNIKAAVLALHGAEDPHVPPAEVAGFQKEMREAKVDWQLISYGRAVHSFTNPAAGDDPSKGAAYDERAARRAWGAMQLFLAETVGRPAQAGPIAPPATQEAATRP